MAGETPADEQESLRQSNEKQRRRRLIWLIIGGAVLVLIIVPLLAGLIYDRYWQGKLNAKVAALRAQGKLLTFQQMLDRDKYLPADKNSALVYAEGFKQLKKDPEANVLELLAYMDELGTRPSPTLMDIYRAETNTNAQGLNAIFSAAPLREGCYPLKPAPSPWELDLPHCKELRQASWLCARAAIWHAADGQAAEATPYLLAGFGLASSFGRKALLYEALVRMAADSITLYGLERSLALCQLTTQDLQDLKTRVEHEDAGLSVAWAMVSERSAVHFTFEQTIGKAGSMASLGIGPLSRWYVLLLGLCAWHQRDELFYDSAMDEIERIVALPPQQEVVEAMRFEDSLDARFKNAWPPPMVSAMAFPSVVRVPVGEVEAKVKLSIAAASLAAEQYRLKNGHWPETLEQLVPEFLDEVPDDPFGTGNIHYKHTKTGVLFYSVGLDGKDNGGHPIDSTHLGDDFPYRLLNPELRGAKTAAFRDEVMGAHVSLGDLKAAGLDEAALKHLGLSDADLKALR